MTGLEIQVMGWCGILGGSGLMVLTALSLLRDLRRTPIPLAETLSAIEAIQRRMDEGNLTEEQRLRVYAVMFGVEGPRRRK